MRKLLIALALLLAGFAPAPFPRTRPAREWTPEGEWVLEWMFGYRLPAKLSGGRYECMGWEGRYWWHAPSRTLTVVERCEAKRYEWAATLDADLSGKFLWCYAYDESKPEEPPVDHCGVIKLTRKQ